MEQRYLELPKTVAKHGQNQSVDVVQEMSEMSGIGAISEIEFA